MNYIITTDNHSVPAAPSHVATPQEELEAAQVLAAAEDAIREIEEKRKEIGTPHRKAVEEVNAAAKIAAAPYEDAKAQAQQVLSDYRLTPSVQEAMARRDRFERAIRAAEKDGDPNAIAAAKEAYGEAYALVPKSVPAGKYAVRYRTKVVLEGIDEALLEDRYFVRVPDEKAIKAALETVGAVTGVTWRTEIVPYCVEINEEE